MFLRALRASRTRQHEDLLALFTLVQGSFLAVELLRLALSILVDDQTHAFALGTHGTQSRSVSSYVAQTQQPRSAFHQCRRHIRRFHNVEWRIPEIARNCNSIKLRACIDDSFMNVISMSQIKLFVRQLVLNCRRSFRVFAVRVISAFPVNSSEGRTTSDSAAVVSNSSLGNSS